MKVQKIETNLAFQMISRQFKIERKQKLLNSLTFKHHSCLLQNEWLIVTVTHRLQATKIILHEDIIS